MTTTTAAAPEVSFDERFWRSVHSLDAAKGQRVIEALLLFRDNPSHPNLHLKSLKHDLDDLMSLRAGRDVRVLLVRRGDTYIWLEAGMRRDIYDKAARGSFIVNPNRRFIGFVDTAAPEAERRRPLPVPAAVVDAPAGVFDHWSTTELAEAGFEADEIAALRGLEDEYALLEVGWSEDRVNEAVRLLELTPEQWRAGETDSGAERRIRDAIADFGGLTGVSQLMTPDELEALAAAPVEDWMIFLHPDQQSVVDRVFEGPARIRGSAGTGKTVVALHRAAALARRYQSDEGRILFTTHARNLSPVLANLFRRLPSAPVDRVDFLSLLELADRVLEDSDAPLVVRPDAVDAAFTTSVDQVVTADSHLDRLQVTRHYLREEITQMIKGRGLSERGEYRSVVRTGRRVGLTRAARDQVWDLHLAWNDAMASLGTVDRADVVLAALVAAESRAEFGWRSAVIDEAQDLTLTGLRLVRAVTNEALFPRDSLLIAGDGAQRVYPGGYTLRQAGVEVRGRTVVLRVNYRNTASILAAALAIAGGEEVTDLDESFRRGETAPTALRQGRPPILIDAPSSARQHDLIADQLRQAVEDPAVDWGDIGVFCHDATAAGAASAALIERHVPVVAVTDYVGIPMPAVKVGTYAEAKGLEFKIVVLPDLTETSLAGAPLSDAEEEAAERRSLELSRLFVALTRSRDLLILGTTNGLPGALAEAARHFELVS